MNHGKRAAPYGDLKPLQAHETFFRGSHVKDRKIHERG